MMRPVLVQILGVGLAPRRACSGALAGTLLLATGLALPAEAAGGQDARTPAAPVSLAAGRDAAPSVAPSVAAAKPSVPPDYVIGADDVLSIQFWRDKDLSTEVTVRPDGKVTLPLLNDIQAAGLTPEQLRDSVLEAARKWVEDPNTTVIVKQINSRKVYITGQVEKAGPYPLNGTMTILQLIAMAGGLKDYVDGKHISVMRTEGGRQLLYNFNYQDVLKQKNLRQNIELKPGDTVVVP